MDLSELLLIFLEFKIKTHPKLIEIRLKFIIQF